MIMIYILVLIIVFLTFIIVFRRKIKLIRIKYRYGIFSPEYVVLYTSIYNSMPHSSPIWNTLPERVSFIFNIEPNSFMEISSLPLLYGVNYKLRTKAEIFTAYGEPQLYTTYTSKSNKYLEVIGYLMNVNKQTTRILVYIFDEVCFLTEVEHNVNESGQEYSRTILCDFLSNHGMNTASIEDINLCTKFAIMDKGKNIALLIKQTFYYSTFYFNDIQKTQTIIKEILK